MLESIVYNDGSGDVVKTAFDYSDLAQQTQVLNERIGSENALGSLARNNLQRR